MWISSIANHNADKQKAKEMGHKYMYEALTIWMILGQIKARYCSKTKAVSLRVNE